MIDLDKRYYISLITCLPETTDARGLKCALSLCQVGEFNHSWVIDEDGFDAGDGFTDIEKGG